MKRIAAVFLCLALMLTTISQMGIMVLAVETPTITCESKECYPGDTVNVEVNLANNPGIMYLEVTPNFSSELGTPTVQNGSIISDLTKGKQYIWVADNDVDTNGTLATMTFTVDESVAPGDYSVGFIFRSAYNYDEESVAFTVVPATVTVKSNTISCSHNIGHAVPAEESTCIKHGHDAYIICDECGEVIEGSNAELPLADHIGGTATCQQKAICTVCGEEYGEFADHNYIEKVEEQYLKSAATTTNKAVYYKSCDVCGVRSTETFEYGDVLPNENAPVVTVERKTGKIGNTVLVTVSLDKNPGIWGMDLVVDYDKTQLTLTNVTNGTVFGASEWTPGNLTGEKYILSYEASEFDNITANGVLATLEFTVDETATVDTFSSITVSYRTGDIINVNFDDIDVAIVSGGIDIIDFIYGDLNGDMLVNKKDSLLMKMYLADNSTVIDMQAADVYFDGSINKKDSLYLKQYLAGLDVELGA